MHKPTISILDDDIISLTTLVNYLSPMANILTSDNGASAIQQIEAGKPDLIILDVLMPGISGLDVCRCIKQNENFIYTPVIFVSGVDDLVGKIAGFSAGAVDYITKPFLVEEVKLRVTTHLDLYFLKRTLEYRVAERTEKLIDSLNSLKEAQKRALRAEKLAALGTMASGIAHEINTPIQFIGDNLTFMQDALNELRPVFDNFREQCIFQKSEERGTNIEYLTAEMAQAIQESLDGISRVRDIVQAVRMFAHPGTINFSPQSPAKLVETAVSVARNSWKQVADLTTEIQPNLPMISCQGSDIDQVLLALLLNAVDAIESKSSTGRGKIKIAVRRIGRDIEFSVTDDGCGIPENIRHLIWDLFFTTKEPSKGTGQGLAICHNIVVVKHGGIIDCESILGKGTRFFFTLPTDSTPIGAV